MIQFPCSISGSQGEGGEGSNSATSPGESRRLSIQRCIQSLVHACQCRDANCRLPSCHKMKRVVTHAKTCKRKGGAVPGTSGSGAPGCPICKQLIALCCYHAKHCNEAKCTVPYCVNIKQKLKQQQMQQRFQQQAILRRRIANMQMQNSMSAAITAAANNNSSSAASEFSSTSVSKPSPTYTSFFSFFLAKFAFFEVKIFPSFLNYNCWNNCIILGR